MQKLVKFDLVTKVAETCEIRSFDHVTKVAKTCEIQPFDLVTKFAKNCEIRSFDLVTKVAKTCEIRSSYHLPWWGQKFIFIWCWWSEWTCNRQQIHLIVYDFPNLFHWSYYLFVCFCRFQFLCSFIEETDAQQRLSSPAT